MSSTESQDWQTLAADLHEKGGVPDRRAKAVALVETGHTYAEAAAKLGIESTNPRSQVGNHIKQYREQDQPQAEWLVDHGPDV